MLLLPCWVICWDRFRPDISLAEGPASISGKLVVATLARRMSCECLGNVTAILYSQSIFSKGRLQSLPQRAWQSIWIRPRDQHKSLVLQRACAVFWAIRFQFG